MILFLFPINKPLHEETRQNTFFLIMQIRAEIHRFWCEEQRSSNWFMPFRHAINRLSEARKWLFRQRKTIFGRFKIVYFTGIHTPFGEQQKHSLLITNTLQNAHFSRISSRSKPCWKITEYWRRYLIKYFDKCPSRNQLTPCMQLIFFQSLLNTP